MGANRKKTNCTTGKLYFRHFSIKSAHSLNQTNTVIKKGIVPELNILKFQFKNESYEYSCYMNSAEG